MKIKELQLDFEALFTQVAFGHGYLHYGYWPDGKPEVASLMALGQAQQAYFDKMLAHFPAGVKTVLDVGSGTGSNARALADLGYTMECVCPSARLNAIANEKLKGEVPIHETLFEDFSSDKTFDMLIFPESFHYIRLRTALEQALKYTDRYILIFDYFRHEDSEGEDAPRGSYRQFLDVVGGFGDRLKILHDEDVTDRIIPTFHVLDEIKNTAVRPFAAKVKQGLEQDHRFYNFLFDRILGKAYKRSQRTSNRFETFPQQYEYRIILMEKTG